MEWCEKQAPRCPACKKLHESRNPPEVPDCSKCRVELIEENDEVGQIYMMLRGQVITAGMGDVIDIDFKAVKIIMDLYKIIDQRSCFEKVYKTFHHFLAEK